MTVILDIAAGYYTFEEKLIGGTYTAGIVVPFGWAELEAGVIGPAGGTISRSADSFNLSDIALTPFHLNWSTDNFYLKVSETIIAPTGGYRTDLVT